MSSAQLLVTGEKFTGHGFRALDPVIEELVDSAKFEITIIAYVISPFAIDFLAILRKALKRGINVTLIVNRLDEQPHEITRFLSGLESDFSKFRLKSFASGKSIVHAKAIVVDRTTAIVGSANLTWGGFVYNHEICVLLKGEPASRLASLLDTVS